MKAEDEDERKPVFNRSRFILHPSFHLLRSGHFLRD